jgi:hypothetical protein
MFTYFVYELFCFNRVECDNGRFGPNCIYTCSGNCLNDLPCNKSTGTCQSCKAGYAGDLCNNSKRFLGLDKSYVLHFSQFLKLTIIFIQKVKCL